MQSDHKNVLVLGTCQMLSGTGRGLFMVTSPAVALGIAPHLALATLPSALIVIGAALAAMPASLFMRRFGRKTGFICGTSLAVASGVSCTAAVLYENFWLLALGGFLYGLFAGFAQLYRFAVADAASEHFRAKAISLVLAGGVFAGLAGPNLANWGKELLANHLFAGSFLVMIGTGLLAAIILLFLNIPNLTKAQRDGPQRPLREIVRQPVFIAAAVSATVAQSVMNFLMTATPIAMISHGGHSFGSVAIVISSHTVAMYAPGFFTGSLIKRFGEIPMITVGLLLEALCIGIALSGIAVFDFWLSMVLLGMGWNFTYTAATSLMTTAYGPAERAKTQGMMNQIIYTVVAIGSLSSGAFIHFFGWKWVNVGAMPLLIVAACVTIWYVATMRKTAES
ncbi:MAG: MFS transporter [Rhodospirillaceae bacterium]|jgi:MFS family permease|nr:MFS transporter [Rhodospirillaceae bacterium]